MASETGLDQYIWNRAIQGKLPLSLGRQNTMLESLACPVVCQLDSHLPAFPGILKHWANCPSVHRFPIRSPHLDAES